MRSSFRYRRGQVERLALVTFPTPV